MVANTSSVTTILVVEDEPSVAQLVRAVLNDVPGWSVVVAYDAHAAIRLLEHVPADVLLVDVNLPGMSGIELLAELRRRRGWHEPPVIVMSANVPPQRVEEVLGPGSFMQFLNKPFDIDQLIDVVHAAAELGRARRRMSVREGQPSPSSPQLSA